MATCLSCGGVLTYRRRYLYRSARFRRVYPSGEVLSCTACGLVQVGMDVVDDDGLAEYYRVGYRGETRIASNATEASRQYYRARALALLALWRAEHPAPARRVFEVGAGFGTNLLAFGDAFPSAALFTDEPDTTVQRDARITSATLQDGPYDAVVLSHVLEHFADPHALLQQAAAALATDGVLILEVPNDSTGESAVTFWDEPHLTFFSTTSLRSLLARVPELEERALLTAGPRFGRPSALRARTREALQAMPQVFDIAWRLRCQLLGVAANATPDFQTPNPQGIFLRAALSRHAA